MKALLLIALFFYVYAKAEVVQVRCVESIFTTYNLASPHSEELSPLIFARPEECESFLKLLKDSTLLSNKYSQDELLKTFNEQESYVGYTYKNCEDWKYDYHIIKSKGGIVREECVPDTLYSWGSYRKLKGLKDDFSHSGDWSMPLKRAIYLTQSPLATFAYGVIPIRFKLKKGVKAILSTDDKNFQGCKGLKDEDKRDTILVRYFGSRFTYTGIDYIICSMGVVDSWSFGTEEHYDEIVREYKWVESNTSKDYELYIKNRSKDLLWDTSIDYHDFSKARFFANLQVFRSMIDNNISGIYEQNEGGKGSHYKTRHPIYFNPE